MSSLQVLGLAAGTITSITFLPQVIQIWKTKICKRPFHADAFPAYYRRIHVAHLRYFGLGRGDHLYEQHGAYDEPCDGVVQIKVQRKK